MSTIHVIGAGLAGLSAAVALTEATGRSVVIHESGPVAGGRCRSFLDRSLGLRIDNGNHLLLSGNQSAMAYLRRIGSFDRLNGPADPVFPFMDLKSGEHWSVRPNAGRIPWWILSRERRVPETRLRDYLALRSFTQLRDETVVADAMPRNALYWKLVEPLAIAALNTRPHRGLARLLGAVIRETLMQGGEACLPRFPRGGLSEALVDPAIAMLQDRGASIQVGRRVLALTTEADRVTLIRTADATIPLDEGDAVVLAVPPWIATDLLPGLTAPNEFEAILNVHFGYLPDPQGLLAQTGFLGLLSGTAEWIFLKQDHVSVTISAANRIVDHTPEAIARATWADITRALSLQAPMPEFRVVKERRATFAATAEQERRRPPARTPLRNLVLAGDWTATGLPATIEGAIRSGRTAANLLLTA
jgi:hydroxysqualene dehydroxylase